MHSIFPHLFWPQLHDDGGSACPKLNTDLQSWISIWSESKGSSGWVSSYSAASDTGPCNFTSSFWYSLWRNCWGTLAATDISRNMLIGSAQSGPAKPYQGLISTLLSTLGLQAMPILLWYKGNLQISDQSAHSKFDLQCKEDPWRQEMISLRKWCTYSS